ncbi:T6SS effector phospholipase Tle3 domain-containing protein, partial [Klebsiella aerogenes]
YMNELTEDGYLPDRLSAATFVKDAGYSPVIRFRWGYKSSVDELNAVGGNILLDEKNAWGGGPFVNGCSA